MQPVYGNTRPRCGKGNSQRYPLELTLKYHWAQWGRRGNTNDDSSVLATVPGTLLVQRGYRNPSSPPVAHFNVIRLSAAVPLRTSRRSCGAIFLKRFTMYIITLLSPCYAHDLGLCQAHATHLGPCGTNGHAPPLSRCCADDHTRLGLCRAHDQTL